LVREGRLLLGLLRWWGWGMGEHVVGWMLGDVHFVIVEGVHGKVVGRVGWMVIHGLVEMGGQESAMVLMREWGGGGIDGHETVSRDGGGVGLEEVAEFPASHVRSGRTGRIGRGDGKVGTGVGGEGMPGRGACHGEESGGEERVSVMGKN